MKGGKGILLQTEFPFSTFTHLVMLYGKKKKKTNLT